MMKTKSVVRPSETQRMVLDLERAGDWALAAWKLALFASQMVRRDEVRHEGDGGERPSCLLV